MPEWSRSSNDNILQFFIQELVITLFTLLTLLPLNSFIIRSSSNSMCLDDEPSEALPTPSPDVDLSRLPGEIMGGDMQCKSHFGNAYRHCIHQLVRYFVRETCLKIIVTDGFVYCDYTCSKNLAVHHIDIPN